MKIVFINGGLGNQIFQYIFYRWLEIAFGEDVILEDSAFFGENVPHNGYQLKSIFGVKARRLSECFDEDVWNYMIREKVKGKSIPQQLLENGIQLSMLLESGDINFLGNSIQVTDDNPYLNKAKGNWYYHGYWMSDRFIEEMMPIIETELKFPAIVDRKNKYYEQLISDTLSVAIHVRRGDMINLGRSMNSNYYSGGIKKFEENFTQAHYFIFSDDLKWCIENSEAMGLNQIKTRVTFVEGNQGANAYRDLQLMASCKHALISWSSFSFLAGLLNKNPNKVILSGQWSK